MDMKNPEDWSNAVTTVVAIASVVANFVAPTSVFGRIIHLLAFNLKKTNGYEPQNGSPKKPGGPPKLL